MPIPDVVPADLDNDFGANPRVNEDTLEAKDRAINSVQQAYAVAETLIYDATRKIRQAAKITAKLNGVPPKNPRTQANQGKDWQSNTSTGALATTCSKIPPRLWMPIENARYLTSASLPEGTPDGPRKTEYFRTCVTKAIKSWPKWRFFIQGLTKETSYFGYAFAGFLDNYEWRPTMFRMDRGFVPAGTEILDDSVPFFAVKYDYLPGDLLALLKKNVDADLDEWKKDNVVEAINNAQPPGRSSALANVRNFEDMIRNGTQWLSFTKGTKLIQTIHLFALEMDGKVSHYVLLADDDGGAYATSEGNTPSEKGLLFQKLDQFETMSDVFRSFVFEYGNGTIQGSMGAGQILYDMAVQVELARNDAFDGLKMASRLKIEVGDSKNINDVKMTVFDDKVILGGGKYQGVNAGLQNNVDAFIALDQQMTRLMDEKVGAFLPPAPVPGTSQTATQVNVQVQREDEIRNAILENFLMQFGLMMYTIVRRITDPESPDKVAKELRKKLLLKISKEELKQLRENEPSETILAFTDILMRRAAAFAAAKTQGPNAKLYDQQQLEQFQAQVEVGLDLAAAFLPNANDENQVILATRQQVMEATTMGNGMPIPVAEGDNHWVHMGVLKKAMPPILQAASQDSTKLPAATALLQHYTTHYELGVEAKTIPKDQINNEKKLISSWEGVLESAQQKAAAEEQIKQVKQAQAALAAGGGAPPSGPVGAPTPPLPPNGPPV